MGEARDEKGMSRQHGAPAQQGHGTGLSRAGLTLTLVIIGVEVDGEVMGDLEGAMGGCSQCPPLLLPGPTGAMAKGARRDKHIPGVPPHNYHLTSYLGGILAPKPRAENFLSLQEKGCKEPWQR